MQGTESSVCHFNEVMNFLDHTHNRGCVFFNDSMIHFFQAERVESALLNCGAVDTALDLSYFYLCHFKHVLAVKHFVY